MKARAESESCILPSRYTKNEECGHDLKFTILPDECHHKSMQVNVDKCIDVCAVIKYLIDPHKSWGLQCHRKPSLPHVFRPI